MIHMYVMYVKLHSLIGLNHFGQLSLKTSALDRSIGDHWFSNQRPNVRSKMATDFELLFNCGNRWYLRQPSRKPDTKRRGFLRFLAL